MGCDWGDAQPAIWLARGRLVSMRRFVLGHIRRRLSAHLPPGSPVEHEGSARVPRKIFAFREVDS
jgi:hypothetical protein